MLSTRFARITIPALATLRPGRRPFDGGARSRTEARA